jgi:phosphotransferase system HPr (HPr) family protein
MTYRAQVEIKDPIGLHARPAALIAKFVKDAAIDVKIGHTESMLVSASSALRLMTITAGLGSKLIVMVDGLEDSAAAEVVTQIQEFLGG